MKKGISGWAFTDRDPDVCFSLAKQQGFDGIELVLGTHGPVTYEATKEQMVALREKAESYGLEMYSLVCDQCWQYPLTANDPAVRQKAEDMVRRQLEIASWLGCDTILVLPGMVEGLTPGGEVVPYDVVYDRALEALKRLAPYAEACGVTIGLENVWNKFLLSPLEMRDFIDKVNSPRVGAYFDVGNVVRDGYPEQWIAILGNRIAKVHFKDYDRANGTADGFVDIGTGDVNYPAVMKALAATGYDGWVTAEVFPAGATSAEFLHANSAAMDCILKNI